MARGEMADYALRARAMGIGLIGSCCGSISTHVRAMAKALGKRTSEEREWRSPTGRAMSAYEQYGHTGTELDAPGMPTS
jgi:5-methyltetrahydrofolate--homocysteine methyltransferase